MISIIALLSSIATASLNNARTKAKKAKESADLRQIITQIEIKRDELNKPLVDITLNGCSACSCWSGNQASAGCASVMTTTMTNIGLPSVLRNPWGYPYYMDENELEGGSCGARDNLYSFDGTTTTGVSIPFYRCQ